MCACNTVMDIFPSKRNETKQKYVFFVNNNNNLLRLFMSIHDVRTIQAKERKREKRNNLIYHNNLSDFNKLIS